MVGLYQRIIDIAYKHKCSHLGSYFSAVDIIDGIFEKKTKEIPTLVLHNEKTLIGDLVII